MNLHLMAWLAWHDYRNEWRLSACAVLALVAVLAPLLVLFGLKSGLVGNLTERLEQDPSVREIIPLAGARLTAEQISRWGLLPEVAFMLPRTRQIAASAELYPAERGQPVTVEMLPTALGDPLTEGYPQPQEAHQVLLSLTAAEKLGVRAGESVQAAFGRLEQGNVHYQRLSLTVLAVLPQERFGRDGLFAPLSLLEAVEDYRDGRAVAAWAWPGSEEASAQQRIYPGFRLYAADLQSVEPLRQYFAGQGIEVATQAQAIAQVSSLSRNLTLLFWIIAGLGISGAFAAMTASAVAAVARKRRELSVLRLLGFPAVALVTFVVLQALYSGALALLLSGALYLAAETLLNQIFSGSAAEQACRLAWVQFAVAGLATLVFSALAAALGGWRIALVEAAEGLRDV